MAVNIDNSNQYFVKEFTKRTLHILTEYKGKYDVTMMVNSAVGLLVIPKEVYFEHMKFPDSVVSEDFLNQLQRCIQVNLYDGRQNTDNSLHTIIRHLRNAVAHGRMTIHIKDTNIHSQMADIESIEFYDKGTTIEKKTGKKINIEFKIIITVDLFRQLLIAIAQYVTNDTSHR